MYGTVISVFKKNDNEEAIQLEQLCPQGGSIKLKFLRTEFCKRSEVYENSIILSAKQNEKLIGIAAGAEKTIRLYGKEIKAVYGYDLRVHPEYRKYGTAKRLTNEVINYFGDEIDCDYTFIAGQNELALGLIRRSFGPKVIIPFLFFVIPVFKNMRVRATAELSSAEKIHHNYLNTNLRVEFINHFSSDRLFGHVSSLKLDENNGCSLWTNENLIQEQVIDLPNHLKIIGAFQRIVHPIIKIPRIPKVNEILKSWFVYDLYSSSETQLRDLIGNINNYALQMKRDFIYVFVQKGSDLYNMFINLKMKMFIVPYYFLARGKVAPKISDNLYVDIRDL